MDNRLMEKMLTRFSRINKKTGVIRLVLAVCLGLFAALPAKSASLQLVTDDWGTNGVPTNVTMYAYVPDNVAPNPPVLVLLHYWGGGASGVFAEAQAGGIVSAADQYGFIMVVPQNPDCWDYSSSQSLTHDGGGQTEAIAHMVNYTINKFHANANRVYVTGTSCGGMMTEALLGVYPDVFKGGAEFAGVPIGGAWTPVTHTAQQWGDLARACDPGYSGSRPRVQLWHGTADGTVNYTNQLEAIMQWCNVLGLSANPTYSNTVTIGTITNKFTHQVWVDACGNTALDAWTEIGGPHGTDANLNAQYVIPFLGLDKVGPVDPEDPAVYCGHTQRGRPHLNAARTTFVGDNGQRLRGPFTSTEWTSASTDVAMIKGMGFNALHLYAESFDISYPTNGSTAPGYSVANVDSIVAQTRTNGLYLIMTIGNGAWNGDYNAAYITNFWKFYAQRYANETHVLFEIQNEPVAWGPPYSSPTATPPGALDMEVAAYKTIRTYAPNTPVLLFTYAVLGDSGGASAALTDIHAFNTNVFGNANAVWTNEVVGFHGYAGATSMSNAVSQIIAAGYPCFMTEFGGGVWGTGVGSLDVFAVADLERLGVSWLTFHYIPPTGVSDEVTDPKHYADVVNWSGLSWTPDFGNWPPVRGPYGNGGYPWNTPDYNGSGLLTGSLRIQAENFDTGGEGVAYHELTATNLGGQYRTNEAVDIEATADTGGGYDVTGTAAGEWLEYTLSVSEPGLYNLALRVAGTTSGSVQVLAGGINGTNLTGAWTVPATGGAQTWTTISNVVFLTPGQQVLHLGILSGGFNLNWLQLSPVTSGILANGTYKLLNGASALAVTGVSSNNSVIASSYTGAAAQQWNLQHIGGGEYNVTCADNGWSLTSGGFYFWNNNHFLIQPAAGGYYRIVPTGSGFCFDTVATNQSAVDEEVSNGGVNQRWAIIAASAPAFPIGLSAVAVSWNQISLTWNAVPGAASYNVKRATTSGGPYTTIASGITATNYADAASTSVNYYYVVSAVAGGVESLNSAEAAANLPYPWQSQDIGSAGVAGSASCSNGVFTVTGSGADIWSTADAFRFVYTSVTGDCTIIARVVSVQNIDGWSKAGVMIRASTNANAANAFIAVTPGNGVSWQYRSSVGNSTVNTATSGLGAPYWVKLVRSSNTFTGYCSPDGTNWTQQGTATFTMASMAYVGLAVTAHNNSSLCTAVFDHLTAPNWPPPTTPTGLAAIASYWNQVNLVWNSLTGATNYNVKRSTVSGGPYTLIATGLTGTNFTDFVASARTGYYYVVSAMVGGSETMNSPEAAVRFPKLAGAIIGTAGSWGNSGNTITNVFDGNLATFFDAPDPGNGDWAGLDFGSGMSNVITQINYCPRSGFESRMSNGVFQAANQSGFSGAVTLFTVTNSPASGTFTSVSITNTSAFRYVRYLSPNGCYGNVAEVEFYGYASSSSTPAPTAPTGLAATAISVSQINLAWNTVTNATGYNVKRSLTNGGPYVIVAGNVTATNYSDVGLATGTTYYYVVSAINAGGESVNNAQVGMTTIMPVPAAPAGLTATAVSLQQINLNWAAASGAASYNLKRSTTNGGSYAVIASGVTTTNYSDVGLAAGTIYYYVVSAVSTGGESANSTQASAATWSPTLGTLVHRYSFSENGGAAVADSVGGPAWTGTLPNGGALSGGQLTLLPASQQYASLPAGAMGSMSNFTVMAWVNLNSSSDWCRIFDFWNNLTAHLFLTPQNGASGTVRFEIMNGGSVQQINCNATMSTGVWHQVAVTLTGTNGVLYLDGAAVGTNSSMTLNPASLGGTANNYLGKSEYANPYLDGALDEFRIYNAGLSADEVAATYALGSGQLLSTNSPAMTLVLTGTNPTLSWPVASAGFMLQSSTNLMLGEWSNVTSPAPQITNGQWQISMPPSTNANTIFYRLVK